MEIVTLVLFTTGFMGVLGVGWYVSELAHKIIFKIKRGVQYND